MCVLCVCSEYMGDSQAGITFTIIVRFLSSNLADNHNFAKYTKQRAFDWATVFFIFCLYDKTKTCVICSYAWS